MKNLITLNKRWHDLMISSLSDTEIVSAFEDYINLFEKSLELGQFIPCDSKGEPLKKPRQKHNYIQGVEMEVSKEWEEYQKALDKVLFEGWVLENGTLCTKKEMMVGGILGDITAYGNAYEHTIEELIQEGMIELKPTENCLKQIGL